MRRSLLVVALVCMAVTATACPNGNDDDADRPRVTTTTVAADAAGSHARGGSVRVAVWGAPDPAAPTLAGAAVRSLVLPQLFRAMPDGRWAPWLVEPGTDRDGDGSTSASFELRAGAAWSDGTPVTADDLRRSMDTRFVAGVDGPATDGTITVRFVGALPGWRRLWSGVDAVSPPRDGVWGGPFAVASMTPGLETVLHPNPGWRGGGPFLDEVRLVLVPEPTMARQLLARGEVDVIAPPAETQRTAKLRAVDGVEVDTRAAAGGWWVGLHISGSLPIERRRTVVASVDRTRFVGTLLDGEAARLDGFAGAEDATWSSTDAAVVGGGDPVLDLVGEIEEPMTYYLHRSMQKRVRALGIRYELRNAESERVEPWLASGAYGAAIVMSYDGPEVCWSCRWGAVDAALAAAADAGDTGAATALEAKVRDGALLLPLWRPRAVVAWRSSVVDGVRANPFGLSAATDAWRWYRP